MAHDRRRHTRFSRFLKFTFTWEGRPEAGVSMDVSLSGAFINAALALPEGTRLTLSHLPGPGEPEIYFQAVTRRSVDPNRRISVVPGFAVLWQSAETAGSPEYLKRVLAAMLQTDVRVRAQHAGGAVWIAAGHPPQRADPVRAALVDGDLKRLNGLRPALAALGALEGTPGFREGVQIICYVNREPFVGLVGGVQDRGFQVRTSGGVPRVGDAVTCHYRSADPSARLVGVVSDVQTGRDRGFVVELVRIDVSAPA